MFQRSFYALDIDKSVEQVSSGCHLCASLKKIPSSIQPQSTCDPPNSVGITFAADVIKRYRQLVFVLRETVISFTCTCLIEDERKDTLRVCRITSG